MATSKERYYYRVGLEMDEASINKTAAKIESAVHKTMLKATQEVQALNEEFAATGKIDMSKLSKVMKNLTDNTDMSGANADVLTKQIDMLKDGVTRLDSQIQNTSSSIQSLKTDMAVFKEDILGILAATREQTDKMLINPAHMRKALQDNLNYAASMAQETVDKIKLNPTVDMDLSGLSLWLDQILSQFDGMDDVSKLVNQDVIKSFLKLGDVIRTLGPEAGALRSQLNDVAVKFMTSARANGVNVSKLANDKGYMSDVAYNKAYKNQQEYLQQQEEYNLRLQRIANERSKIQTKQNDNLDPYFEGGRIPDKYAGTLEQQVKHIQDLEAKMAEITDKTSQEYLDAAIDRVKLIGHVQDQLVNQGKQFAKPDSEIAKYWTTMSSEAGGNWYVDAIWELDTQLDEANDQLNKTLTETKGLLSKAEEAIASLSEGTKKASKPAGTANKTGSSGSTGSSKEEVRDISKEIGQKFTVKVNPDIDIEAWQATINHIIINKLPTKLKPIPLTATVTKSKELNESLEKIRNADLVKSGIIGSGDHEGEDKDVNTLNARVDRIKEALKAARQGLTAEATQFQQEINQYLKFKFDFAGYKDDSYGNLTETIESAIDEVNATAMEHPIHLETDVDKLVATIEEKLKELKIDNISIGSVNADNVNASGGSGIPVVLMPSTTPVSFNVGNIEEMVNAILQNPSPQPSVPQQSAQADKRPSNKTTTITEVVEPSTIRKIVDLWVGLTNSQKESVEKKAPYVFTAMERLSKDLTVDNFKKLLDIKGLEQFLEEFAPETNLMNLAETLAKIMDTRGQYGASGKIQDAKNMNDLLKYFDKIINPKNKSKDKDRLSSTDAQLVEAIEQLIEIKELTPTSSRVADADANQNKMQQLYDFYANIPDDLKNILAQNMPKLDGLFKELLTEQGLSESTYNNIIAAEDFERYVFNALIKNQDFTFNEQKAESFLRDSTKNKLDLAKILSSVLSERIGKIGENLDGEAVDYVKDAAENGKKIVEYIYGLAQFARIISPMRSKEYDGEKHPLTADKVDSKTTNRFLSGLAITKGDIATITGKTEDALTDADIESFLSRMGMTQANIIDKSNATLMTIVDSWSHLSQEEKDATKGKNEKVYNVLEKLSKDLTSDNFKNLLGTKGFTKALEGFVTDSELISAVKAIVGVNDSSKNYKGLQQYITPLLKEIFAFKVAKEQEDRVFEKIKAKKSLSGFVDDLEFGDSKEVLIDALSRLKKIASSKKKSAGDNYIADIFTNHRINRGRLDELNSLDGHETIDDIWEIINQNIFANKKVNMDALLADLRAGKKAFGEAYFDFVDIIEYADKYAQTANTLEGLSGIVNDTLNGTLQEVRVKRKFNQETGQWEEPNPNDPTTFKRVGGIREILNSLAFVLEDARGNTVGYRLGKGLTDDGAYGNHASWSKIVKVLGDWLDKSFAMYTTPELAQTMQTPVYRGAKSAPPEEFSKESVDKQIASLKKDSQDKQKALDDLKADDKWVEREVDRLTAAEQAKQEKEQTVKLTKEQVEAISNEELDKYVTASWTTEVAKANANDAYKEWEQVKKTFVQNDEELVNKNAAVEVAKNALTQALNNPLPYFKDIENAMSLVDDKGNRLEPNELAREITMKEFSNVLDYVDAQAKQLRRDAEAAQGTGEYKDMVRAADAAEQNVRDLKNTYQEIIKGKDVDQDWYQQVQALEQSRNEDLRRIATEAIQNLETALAKNIIGDERAKLAEQNYKDAMKAQEDAVASDRARAKARLIAQAESDGSGEEIVIDREKIREQAIKDKEIIIKTYEDGIKSNDKKITSLEKGLVDTQNPIESLKLAEAYHKYYVSEEKRLKNEKQHAQIKKDNTEDPEKIAKYEHTIAYANNALKQNKEEKQWWWQQVKGLRELIKTRDSEFMDKHSQEQTRTVEVPDEDSSVSSTSKAKKGGKKSESKPTEASVRTALTQLLTGGVVGGVASEGIALGGFPEDIAKDSTLKEILAVIRGTSGSELDTKIADLESKIAQEKARLTSLKDGSGTPPVGKAPTEQKATKKKTTKKKTEQQEVKEKSVEKPTKKLTKKEEQIVELEEVLKSKNLKKNEKTALNNAIKDLKDKKTLGNRVKTEEKVFINAEKAFNQAKEGLQNVEKKMSESGKRFTQAQKDIAIKQAKGETLSAEEQKSLNKLRDKEKKSLLKSYGEAYVRQDVTKKDLTLAKGRYTKQKNALDYVKGILDTKQSTKNQEKVKAPVVPVADPKEVKEAITGKDGKVEVPVEIESEAQNPKVETTAGEATKPLNTSTLDTMMAELAELKALKAAQETDGGLATKAKQQELIDLIKGGLKVNGSTAEGGKKSEDKKEADTVKYTAQADRVNKNKAKITAEMNALLNPSNDENFNLSDYINEQSEESFAAWKRYNDLHANFIRTEKEYLDLGDDFTEAQRDELIAKEAELKIAENALKQQINRSKKINDNTTTKVSAEGTDSLEAKMREFAGVTDNAAEHQWKFNEATREATYVMKDSDNTVRHMKVSYDGLQDTLNKSTQKQVASFSNMEKFIQSFGAKWKEVIRYFGTFATVQRAFEQLRKGFQYVREIDMALTELKKVTNETDATYKKFLQTMSSVAGVVGSTTTELTKSAADWSRLGYSIEEAGVLAQNTAVLMNVSEFTNVEAATSALISSLQAFGYEASNSIEIVDKLNIVGNNFAISTDGLAEGLKRSASTLVAAGNSLEESIAMLAAGNKVVQDPEGLGNALKVLSMRIRGTKSELEAAGEETDGLITNTSKLQSKIKALTNIDGKGGVDILTDTGAYRSTYQILLDIAQIWEDIDDMDQAALLELLAGKTRGSQLAAILQNPEDLKDAYETALDSSGSAQHELDTYLDSIQGRIELFTNAVQTMWMNLIDSDLVKGVVDIGTALVKVLDQIGVVGATAFGTLTSFIVKNKINLVDLVSEFKNWGQMFSVGLSAVEMSKDANWANGGMAKYIKNMFNSQELSKEASSVVQKMFDDKKFVVKPGDKNAMKEYLDLALKGEVVSQQITTATYAEIAAKEGLVATNLTLSQTFEVLKTSVISFFTTNPVGQIMLIAGAVAAAVAVFDLLTVSMEEQKEKLQEAKKAYETVESELKTLQDELKTTKERIEELNAIDKLSFTEEEELRLLKQQNAELERKIYLKELEAKIERDKQNQEFVDTIKKDKTTLSDVNGQMGYTKETAFYSELERYKELDRMYQQAMQDAQTAKEAGDEAEYKKQNRLVEQYRGWRDQAAENAKAYKDEWVSIAEGISYVEKPMSDLDKETNKLLDSVRNAEDLYAITIDPTAQASTHAFNRVADKNEFKDELESLEKQGVKTGEQLRAMLSFDKNGVLQVTNGEFSDFIQNLIRCGFIADTSAESLQRVADAIYKTGSFATGAEPSTEVLSYGVLSEAVTNYKDILQQTEEIVIDNTEVTQEYKDSLVALGVREKDLNACFDENNKLIVKDASALNKLVKSAKSNTAQNIKLAKSQAKLQYYEKYKQLRDLTNGQEVNSIVTMMQVKALYAEMTALQKTIARYSMLEHQLLGATNAYEEFAKAQEVDGENDYETKAEELVGYLVDAFHTAKLGTESAQAAIKGLVPESVYADLDTLDAKMQAVYDYFTTDLSKYFYVKFNDDGSLESAEMLIDNVKQFVEDGVKKGVFTGSWEEWDLDSSIDSLDELAKKMNVTKEVAYAFLQSMETYDISWIGGDASTLLDKLIPTTSQIEAFAQQMQDEFNQTPIDLTARIKVSAEKMHEAGYTEFDDGDYATLYSQTFKASEFDILKEGEEDYAINVTPILPDGTVISNGEDGEGLYNYIMGQIKNGQSIEDLNIFLGTYKTIEEAEAAGRRLSQLQKDYYGMLSSYNLENAIYSNTQKQANLEYKLGTGQITLETVLDEKTGLTVREQLRKIEEETQANAKSARENAVAWTEAQDEYNKASDRVQELNDELATATDGVTENGYSVEELKGQLSEAENEMWGTYAALVKLGEPTEVVIQVALDDVKKDIEVQKKKLEELEITIEGSVQFDEEKQEYIWVGVQLDPNDPRKAEIDKYIASLNEEHTLNVLQGDGTTSTLDTLNQIKDILSKTYELLVKADNALTTVQSFADIWHGIKDKTVTLRENVVKSVTQFAESIFTRTPDDGDDFVNGTAHVRGTAYKGGSWGAPRSETALVGELGPELVKIL